MTRVAEREDLWRRLFHEQHARLTAAAEAILHRKASTEQILRTALEDSEGRPFHEIFGPASALRSVVKAAIASNHTVNNHEDPVAVPTPKSDEGENAHPLLELPWAERAVYFLRAVLNYSRRDTALLLEMSDAHVDQLMGFAETRIRLDSQTSQTDRVTDAAEGSLMICSYELLGRSQ